VRHPRYYFEDGNLYIMVDDILFNLHRSILCAGTGSPYHDALMQWTGRSESHPLRLREMTSDGFEMFISLLYPSVETPVARPRTPEDWITILDQSHKWGCNKIKALAVDRLKAMPMDHVLKIAVWTKYGLDDADITLSYHALGIRAQPLTTEEGRLLELDTVVKLAALRDRVHQG
ncbi:hypothetical protein C8Q76DRAFT_595930, partial [Earliella scabrosa]